MSVDRIATAQQSAYFLSQINKASAALNTTNQQIASQDVATTYSGFGDQTQVLTASISANARNDAYTAATNLATTDDAHLFGATEFKIRALAHKIAAKAIEQHLARKKTDTTAPG